MAHCAIGSRLRAGWSIEKALTTPPQKSGRRGKCRMAD
jgi:hypothetical protein